MRYSEILPDFFDKASLNVPSIVDENINTAIDLEQMVHLGVDCCLRCCDTIFENCSASFCERLETCDAVSSGGYHIISSCEDRIEKLLAQAR